MRIAIVKVNISKQVFVEHMRLLQFAKPTLNYLSVINVSLYSPDFRFNSSRHPVIFNFKKTTWKRRLIILKLFYFLRIFVIFFVSGLKRKEKRCLDSPGNEYFWPIYSFHYKGLTSKQCKENTA